MRTFFQSAPDTAPNQWFGNLAVLGFVIVQYMDGVLTYLGLHTFGMGIEANPIISSAINFAGPGAGVFVAKLFAIALGIGLHLRRVHVVVALLTGFYLAAAIVPWTLLFLHSST